MFGKILTRVGSGALAAVIAAAAKYFEALDPSQFGTGTVAAIAGILVGLIVTGLGIVGRKIA